MLEQGFVEKNYLLAWGGVGGCYVPGMNFSGGAGLNDPQSRYSRLHIIFLG